MTADAIVVGSGAAGGWVAKNLAQGGARVLLLEAGPLLGGDHRVDRAAHDGSRQPVQSRSSAWEQANSRLFVDDLDNPYRTAPDEPFHWFRGRQAGGRLLLWAGVCLRFSDRQFSGTGTGRRWPIRHRDLDPYYREVERFMGVTGGGEPCAAVPAPAPGRRQPMTSMERHLAVTVAARWPGRQLLSSRTATAPADSLLSAALRTGRVRLHPDAVVSHLELDRTGRRAEGVVFVDRVTRVTHRASAPVVVLCASTVESVRILLNTRTPEHPDGLGNRHDQLGRYLLDHVGGASVSGVTGRADDDPGEPPRPSSAPSLVPVCHLPDFGGGYGVTAFVPDLLPASAGSAAWASSAGGRPFRMWATGEVLPAPENRITLADGADAWGIRPAGLRMVYGERERAMITDQVSEMRAMAAAAGFETRETVAEALTPGSSVHELGGAAMGDSPMDSVVDPANRLWEAPNVLVADGACFRTAGWQQPTLTIMALAARAAATLTHQARRGSPTGALS